MNYKILQLKNIDEAEYGFMGWNFAKEYGFSLDDYEIVYEGTLPEDLLDTAEPEAYLDYIFEKFNLNHPADFRGHSLSVSDVVELNGIKYYCDHAGWEEIK